MKLTRNVRITLALIAVFVGWLMIGLGYATPLGIYPINTIVLLLGFGVGLLGLVWFIWTASSKG